MKLLKALAIILFLALPIIGFILGENYQKNRTVNTETNSMTTPTNSLLHLITPKSGEVLCLGQYYKIQWQVPPETSGVTLKIAEAKNGDTIHDIGNFSTNYGRTQPGSGVFSWHVGFNRDGASLIPGPGYHILIRGIYKQYELINSSDYFTITTCSK